MRGLYGDRTGDPSQWYQYFLYPRPTMVPRGTLGLWGEVGQSPTSPRFSSFLTSSFSSLLLRVSLLPSLPEYLWKVVTIVVKAFSRGVSMVTVNSGGSGEGAGDIPWEARPAAATSLAQPPGPSLEDQRLEPLMRQKPPTSGPKGVSSGPSETQGAPGQPEHPKETVLSCLEDFEKGSQAEG